MTTKMKSLLTAIALIAITSAMDSCQTHHPTEAASAGIDTTLATADSATEPSLSVNDTIKTRAPLTLNITNLATPDAPVTVGVYGTKNKFPDPKGQLKVYKFRPHGLILTATITGLPFGTYALAIYQDVKGTGKISKNLIGIPTDPYAFSRNYKPTVKAPGFDDCKFEYNAKSNSIAMSMIR